MIDLTAQIRAFFDFINTATDWIALFSLALGCVYLPLSLRANSIVALTKSAIRVILVTIMLLTVLYYLYDLMGMNVAFHNLIATGFNIATITTVWSFVFLAKNQKQDKHTWK